VTDDRSFPEGPDSDASGLEFVDSIDDAGSYETLSVWRDKETGRIYYASDSGCSCPTPFENYTTLSSLTTEESLGAFDADLAGGKIRSTFARSSVAGCSRHFAERVTLCDLLALPYALWDRRPWWAAPIDERDCSAPH
jgi:hypothetical protein